MPEIFQYEFMIRAILASVLVGATAPAFGVFLVLRRLSLMADTLSHVALAGVAVALLTKTFAPAVALVATTGAAVSIEELRMRRLLPGDAALAVFLYGALAVAVVLISIAEGFNSTLFSYLFGSVLTVSTTDLWWMATLAVVIAVFMALFSSELAQVTFDTDLARINGVRVHLLNLGLAVLTGATITVSMRVVGLLLVGALIVIPVIISLRITGGLARTVFASSAIGVFVAVTGMVIAFYADIAPGGSVVLTAICLLVIVEAVAFTRRLSSRSIHLQIAEMQQHAHAHESHAHGANDDAGDNLSAGTRSHR
ncbi:MAG: metal ABC transporter permease [Chloroflexi bacterium]|nr:metal ABC transporter permease [Chloroflexota bacterium]MCI0775914.1 metal ABC transporter permease [Chloroflexota bacterium]MCI0804433.1 metal ABC transporter permease [Chloroflexota bacterium]MCI0835905.1 metal ABC transporter permease [Chloroflexota bacterium]MCI0852103.1 metal ABC transporter permease [Chloroflexota bacterium]